MEDAESQCNFYVRDLANKHTQTVVSKRKSSLLTLSQEDENDEPKKKISRRNTIIPPENPITTSRPVKFQIIIDWLSSKSKNSAVITYGEKFGTAKANATFPSEFNKAYLEVTRSDIFMPQLSLEPARVLIDSEGEARLMVVFKGCVMKKKLFDDETFLDNEAVIVFEPLLSDQFIMCPGLTNEAIAIVKSRPIMPKNITEFFYPTSHICSQKCLVWFKISSKAPIADVSSGKYACSNCSYASRYSKKLSNKEYTSLKNKQSPSSHVNLKYLSPRSARTRRSIARNRKHRLFLSKEKLQEKCHALKIKLSKKQTDEV